MTDSWENVICAAASAVVAVVFLAAVAGSCRDRSACSAHAAMALGMMGMFVAGLDVVPTVAGVVVFALITCWFVARWMRDGTPPGGRAEAAHLVVAPAAMVLMYLMMAVAPTGGMEMGPGAAPGMDTTAASAPLFGGLSIVLIVYFVGYSWVIIGRLTRGPVIDDADDVPAVLGSATAVTTVARPRAARTVAVAHIVMCLLMAVMFTGSV